MERIPSLLTISDVKRLIGVSSDATVYSLMRNGKLPYRQIGKNRRFTMDDIKEFLNLCKPTKKTHQ